MTRTTSPQAAKFTARRWAMAALLGAALERVSIGLVAVLIPLSLAQGQEPPPAVASDAELIDRMPSPSRILVRGELLVREESYRLVVEFVTQREVHHKALLVYAEPSHRLLFVQWFRPPDYGSRRRIDGESPLVTKVGDFERREVKIPFLPDSKDDSVLVQFVTRDDERTTVLSGRVGNLRRFEVESAVFD